MSYEKKDDIQHRKIKTKSISEKYYSAIANIFTPSVIVNLINTGKSKYLSEVLSESRLLDTIDKNITLYKFFNWTFNFISKTYRNEYVYKNLIATRILEDERADDLSYMLTELDAGICKADVVILNGTSIVYEIKSKYDSLDRIYKQIGEYKKVFDKINVITCESQVSKLEKILPDDIGLILLTTNNAFDIIKQAKPNKKNVLQDVIFDSLRKNEYIKIINKHYGYIPDVPNTLIYRVCQRLFQNLSPDIAHDEMVSMLSERKEAGRIREFFNVLPFSLMAFAIGHNMQRLQTKNLGNLLDCKLKEVIYI